MPEGKAHPVISPKDILVRNKEIRLNSLDQVGAHLEERSGLFVSRLASISMDSGRGWERVTLTGPKKDAVFRVGGYKPAKEHLFTGDKLCALAARGLRDGLSHVLQPGSPLKVDLVQAKNVDMDVENRGKPYHSPAKEGHFFVKVSDVRAERARYFDAAYGQVDHREAGRIVETSPEEIKDRYGISPEEIEVYLDDDIDRGIAFPEYKRRNRISDAGYDSLVRTITDSQPDMH
jgi:hypothetical protein